MKKIQFLMVILVLNSIIYAIEKDETKKIDYDNCDEKCDLEFLNTDPRQIFSENDKFCQHNQAKYFSCMRNIFYIPCILSCLNNKKDINKNKNN